MGWVGLSTPLSHSTLREGRVAKGPPAASNLGIFPEENGQCFWGNTAGNWDKVSPRPACSQLQPLGGEMALPGRPASCDCAGPCWVFTGKHSSKEKGKKEAHHDLKGYYLSG